MLQHQVKKLHPFTQKQIKEGCYKTGHILPKNEVKENATRLVMCTSLRGNIFKELVLMIV